MAAKLLTCNKHYSKILLRFAAKPTTLVSTLANSTLIILFSESLKFSKNNFFRIKKIIVKKNSEYLAIFHLLKWKFPKLINYSTNMCWYGQGTMVWFAHPCAWHDVNGWVMNILGCWGPLVSIRGVNYFIFSWTCEHVCVCVAIW
jgi:hypothetical protein